MGGSTMQTTFHGLVFFGYCFTCFYDFAFVDTRRNLGIYGKLMFLTIWNLILQTLYYGLCTVTDLTTDRHRSVWLKKWRDNMHATLAFPVGMFVVATFWILYAIDRELVFPKALDEFVPSWLNHMLHTAVFPFIMLDKAMIQHTYPRRHIGIMASVSLALVYLAWILFIAYKEKFWVYPVLEVLQNHERAIFISFCCMLFASFYILGESITTFMWGKNSSSKKQSRSKRN